MATQNWICDSCGESDESEPWDCPGCEKEVCESCGWEYAHCKKCCDGKTSEELRLAAIDAGFEFEAEEHPQ